MTYKLVIFDFDGTLADTLPFMVNLADQLAAKHNVKPLEKTDIPFLRNLNVGKLMKIHNVPMWKLPILARDVQVIMHENIGEIEMFPGMAEVIHHLSDSGIQLAVVTSNMLDNVKQVLGEEIVSLISFFECGVSIFGKTEKLVKILLKSMLPAGDILCIGDEIRDIQAAVRAGLPCAAVTWGFTSQLTLEKLHPNHMITDAGQIIDLVC